MKPNFAVLEGAQGEDVALSVKHASKESKTVNRRKELSSRFHTNVEVIDLCSSDDDNCDDGQVVLINISDDKNANSMECSPGEDVYDVENIVAMLHGDSECIASTVKEEFCIKSGPSNEMCSDVPDATFFPELSQSFETMPVDNNYDQVPHPTSVTKMDCRVLQYSKKNTDEMSKEQFISKTEWVKKEGCVKQKNIVTKTEHDLLDRLKSRPISKPKQVVLTRAQPMPVGRRSGVVKPQPVLEVTKPNVARVYVVKPNSKGSKRITLKDKLLHNSGHRLRTPGGGSAIRIGSGPPRKDSNAHHK